MDWHVPGLMILLLTGCNVKNPDFLHTEESMLISPDLWRRTDNLPQKIADELDGLVFDPELFDLYLIFATKYVSRLENAREILEWAEFLTQNNHRFQHLL